MRKMTQKYLKMVILREELDFANKFIDNKGNWTVDEEEVKALFAKGFEWSHLKETIEKYGEFGGGSFYNKTTNQDFDSPDTLELIFKGIKKGEPARERIREVLRYCQEVYAD